ncbi:MFS transporter [Rhodococcus sp. SORGH_AS_0301]|uniref:MFS transporter n=1 Tax=Rhodococcus sp. SORGH_AS_0301 TaxID=3041780 RepID=UPI0027D8C036|nr:MFS transporter [Rhodococcus sp. SORGH_AS_0301]
MVLTLAAAGSLAAAMQTLVTPLLPALPTIFNTTAAGAAWIVTVTLLAGAVSVPVTGRLGDLYGKKFVLLACTVPLIAGSILCALSESLFPAIVGRGLQGVGMGIIPLGVALLRDVVPPHRLNRSIALVSASMGIGGGLGLPISAAVAEYADWRALFWGAAVATAAVALLVWRLIPAAPAGDPTGRFDLLGAVLLGVGLVSLLLVVSKGAEWGWVSPAVLGAAAVCIVALLLWWRWERRFSSPLIDIGAATTSRVLLTNAASLFVGFSMYASMLVVPQLLQAPLSTGHGLGQSMLAAGLWMLPGGLIVVAVAPLGGKLIDLLGPKAVLLGGTTVLIVGYGIAQALLSTTWGVMSAAIIINAGVGLCFGSMPALILSSVHRSQSAAANGFNTLVRSLGTAIGAAVTGAILAHATTNVGGAAVATEAAFRVTLGAGLMVAVVALALATFIPKYPARPTTSADSGSESAAMS